MSNSSIENVTIADAPTEYKLSALDRCDSCGAQAYIRAEMASGELLFCAHHGHKHEEKLRPLSISWLDESDRILA